MIVYTGQMAKWRSYMAAGLPLIDTTVKTGESIFAPTWEIVQGVKSGRISEAEYTEAYVTLMHQRMRQYPHQWHTAVLASEGVICCFCTAFKFCHRYLLIDILENYCLHHHIEFIYKGEYTA
jgi:hypothetical protein